MIIGDRHVGLHPYLADSTTAWRIEFGNGQSNAAGERLGMKQPLNAPFAVCCFTNQYATVVVTNGTCQNFAGAGALVIDQKYQGNLPRAAASGRVVLIFDTVFATCADNATFGQEAIGHRNGGVEPSTGITTHVDDQALHSLSLQTPQRFVQFVSSGLLEAVDLQICYTCGWLDQLDPFDARDLDAAANDYPLDFAVVALAHQQSHLTLLGPAQQISRALGTNFDTIHRTDLDNPILRFKPRFQGRTTGDDIQNV